MTTTAPRHLLADRPETIGDHLSVLMRLGADGERRHRQHRHTVSRLPRALRRLVWSLPARPGRNTLNCLEAIAATASDPAEQAYWHCRLHTALLDELRLRAAHPTPGCTQISGWTVALLAVVLAVAVYTIDGVTLLPDDELNEPEQPEPARDGWPPPTPVTVIALRGGITRRPPTTGSAPMTIGTAGRVYLPA
ncbi:hypothetical protein [Frankia sp. Cr1]|uniref:hypothetical protein n=1 Tax=Frankia sp. Cr1 TaxID=3073931 RepID=UPI002AD36AEB|nr:hypothetical protein [Frankia sp. Cr1]